MGKQRESAAVATSQQQQQQQTAVRKSQWSTSFSDALLGVACAYAVSILLHIDAKDLSTAFKDGQVPSLDAVTAYLGSFSVPRLYSAICFLMMGVAASLGVFRFALQVWPIIILHEFFAALSKFVGLPLLGLSAWSFLMGEPHEFMFKSLTILWLLFLFYEVSDYSMASSLCLLASFLSLGYLGHHQWEKSGAPTDLEKISANAEAQAGLLVLGGIALNVVAGIVGTRGTLLLGLKKVDLFHFFLCAANVAIAMGLTAIYP